MLKLFFLLAIVLTSNLSYCQNTDYFFYYENHKSNRITDVKITIYKNPKRKDSAIVILEKTFQKPIETEVPIEQYKKLLDLFANIDNRELTHTPHDSSLDSYTTDLSISYFGKGIDYHIESLNSKDHESFYKIIQYLTSICKIAEKELYD